MKPRPLFGEAPAAAEGDDQREALATWITSPQNHMFAQVMANRVWADLMTRGFVEPVDDMRATNPPTNGPLLKALGEGRATDIVVVTEDVIADARAKGFIVPGTETEIGRVGIGVCVHESAPLPDISTAEALKATLLAAKSIVYIDPKIGTSGKHLAGVFSKLGIADQIAAKAKLGTGGLVTEPVGRGEIEIGLHQITEILPVKGAKLVGPLPAPLQKVTVYIGAVSTKAKNPEAARRFLAAMRTAPVRAAFAKRGYME